MDTRGESALAVSASEAARGPAPATGSALERAGSGKPAEPDRGDRDLPGDFERWYREHRPSVYRYVRFRVATREAAEDVTSDVFLKALRSFARYDASRATPRTWLLRIAHNAVADHLRMLKRRASLHVTLDRVPDLVSEVPSQEERLLRQERIEALLNGSRSLRAADQEILALRYGAALDNSEISENLNISPNAVAVRLHRALKRLRQAVEATG